MDMDQSHLSQIQWVTIPKIDFLTHTSAGHRIFHLRQVAVVFNQVLRSSETLGVQRFIQMSRIVHILAHLFEDQNPVLSFLTAE